MSNDFIDTALSLEGISDDRIKDSNIIESALESALLKIEAFPEESDLLVDAIQSQLSVESINDGESNTDYINRLLKRGE